VTICGVDPGLRGGIALVGMPAILCETMPVLSTGKGSKQTLDLCRLRAVLMRAKHVVIESQQPFPRQGGCSNFTTGYGYGALQGLCTGLGIPFTCVRPQVWKRSLGIVRGDKEQSIIVAKRLFPGVSLLPTPRCRKESDGIAEALLIAEWGRRIL